MDLYSQDVSNFLVYLSGYFPELNLGNARKLAEYVANERQARREHMGTLRAELEAAQEKIARLEAEVARPITTPEVPKPDVVVSDEVAGIHTIEVDKPGMYLFKMRWVDDDGKENSGAVSVEIDGNWATITRSQNTNTATRAKCIDLFGKEGPDLFGDTSREEETSGPPKNEERADGVAAAFLEALRDLRTQDD